MKFAANYDNQINNELYFHHPVLKGEYVFCRNFILEGGSIESDGKGSLLTTEQCLLAKNRNEMNRQEVEDFLKETFNLKQVLWLKHGYLAGDDTDSHVDTLARFCPDDTIVYVKCTNEKDEHYKELAMMEEELKAFRTLDGRPYRLLPLPMASAVYDEEHHRLPATYANFLIMNEAVLYPTYADSVNDMRAKEVLAEAFPHHNIEQVAAAGAQLVVLQELHNTPYFCQTEDTDMFDLAEPVPGPSTGFYSELAAGYGIVLVTSLFEKRAPGLYHNTAVVFDKDGSIAGKYRKMHIPDDPAYYEKFYFTPGDLGFEPIQTSLGKLGVQVCWDQWYPEGARLMALKGAEILIYPTAIGWESTDTQEEKIRQLGAWVTVQRGHAVANGLPVIAVNRVGHEPDPSGQTNGIQFWGNSFVAGPQGEILAQANNMDEENMVVELDMTRSENVRRWWPFLRDRRIDEFENLTRRFID